MTSVTQASLSYVQELGTFLGPQNRTQGRCVMTDLCMDVHSNMDGFFFNWIRP